MGRYFAKIGDDGSLRASVNHMLPRQMSTFELKRETRCAKEVDY